MARRAHAYLVAIALVLSTGSGTSIAYLCSMSGEVGPSCCCASVDATHDAVQPDGTAKVERASCCDVQRYDAQAPLGTHERSQGYAGAGVIGTVSSAVAPASLPAPCEASLSEPRGPPLSLGPAIFVQNCSFLI